MPLPAGSTTKLTVPAPGRLSIVSCPFIASVSQRASGSPSPGRRLHDQLHYQEYLVREEAKPVLC